MGLEEGWGNGSENKWPGGTNQHSFSEGKQQDLMERIKGIVLLKWMMVESLIEAVKLNIKDDKEVFKQSGGGQERRSFLDMGKGP